MELSQYCYDTDKDGKFLDRPIKESDHSMDGLRYSLEGVFGSGTGMVIEAGMDNPVEVMPSTTNKCRRVFSTYD